MYSNAALMLIFFVLSVQGGVSDKNSSVPLTAFVLAALLEAGARTNMSIVKGAIRCLLSERSKDPHTMALKAYALIMAENRGGKDLLRKLLALAVEKENVLYWKPLEGTSKFVFVVLLFFSRSGARKPLSFEFDVFVTYLNKSFRSVLYSATFCRNFKLCKDKDLCNALTFQIIIELLDYYIGINKYIIY